MKKQTCQELGFCQALAECPQGSVTSLPECHVACSAPTQTNYPFAPGVIEGSQDYVPLGRIEVLSIWITVLAIMAGLLTIFAFVAGYVPMTGWLL